MPFTSYIRLFTNQGRLLSFGFVMSFSSSFGQTYFIGIFGPAIQLEFGLSHTLWGTIYLVGTLASAIVLPWTGALIDRFSLPRYTLFVGLLLIVACVFISLAAGVISLIMAIFLLRQSGQGLTSHISVTTMARYFEAERGRAIAVATFGFAAGEALLPFLAVASISVIGWRWTYGATSGVLGIVLLPLALWLLQGHRHHQHGHRQKTDRGTVEATPAKDSWTRPEVLRDTRFYLLLPGLIAPALIITALFFHHLNLADAKGWSHAWITGNYVVYAVSVVLTALIAGPLIDRFRAVRLVPFIFVPLVLALALVSILNSPGIVLPYMLLIGINSGLVYTTTSAMWPELYGVKHLGAIKSLGFSVTVVGSALGPVILGGLMDLGISIESVCLLFVGYSIFGGALIFVALHGTWRNLGHTVRPF
jgi:MFS family permease